jgi:uncharacterized MnhB-related membrane protein
MGSIAPFDAALSVTLVAVAARALMVRELFHGVVLFIVFGLLMSLAWTRLDAVDVALAEAAIGAGLTGALFLNALGAGNGVSGRAAYGNRNALLFTLVFGCGFAVALGAALFALPAGGAGLRGLVDAHLARSGASNPVTAVLLNFRAYDTLLEVVVLVLAVAAVWALGPGTSAPLRGGRPGPVLLALIRVLLPLMGIVAAYLLWAGASAPGGAFQAGAVLCAAGVLLVVGGLVNPPTLQGWRERAVVTLGLAGFLAVALGVMAGGQSFLAYPASWASSLILAIELAVTVSIAMILVALFSGGRSPGGAPDRE